MTFSLRFHPEVQNDIGDSYNWYEDRQEGPGERFLIELEFSYTQLELHPRYYGKSQGNLRRIQLNTFPYIVAFEIKGNSIFVYAVFHQKRNQKLVLVRKRSLE